MKKIIKKLILVAFILGFSGLGSNFALANGYTPVITSPNASNVSGTSVTLNAYIDPGLAETTVRFLNCSGTVISQDFTVHYNAGPGTLVSYTWSGLTINTGYGFKVWAHNSNPPDVTSTCVNFTTTSGGGGGQNNPSITSLSPSSGAQGQTNLDVNIYGTNLTSSMSTSFSGSGINVNSTTFVSSTQLKANIDISSSATASTRNVSVSGVTGTLSFTVNSSGSGTTSPTISSLSPNNGDQGQSMTVNISGSNFANSNSTSNVYFGSGINVNSVNYINSSNITANISISSSASTGSRNVTVSNTYGTSSSYNFTVNSINNGSQCNTSDPYISSITPNTIDNSYNGGYTTTSYMPNTTTITIYGSNFTSNSTAMWNGSNRSTTYVNSGRLTMTLYYSDLTSSSGDITVTNNNGCAESNYKTLTITGNNNNTPTVMTLSASINGGTTTMYGNVNPNGSVVTTWFRYGTSSSYLGNETPHVSQVAANYSVNFNAIKDLTPNTIYYFQAVANNPYAGGNVYGSILNFSTGSSTNNPTVTTTLATNKTTSGARLNGVVAIQYGMNTQAFFEYGTTANLGNTTNAQNLGSSGTLSFSDSVLGLSPNTTYYFRAAATNTNGTSYGSKFIFKTLSDGTDVTPVGPQNTTVQSSILKITTNDTKVAVGDSVEYLVTFMNDTRKNFDNVKVSVQIPPEINFDKSNFGVINSDNTVVFDVGTLVGGQNGSMIIKGHVSNAAANQAVVMVTATMTFSVAGDERGEISYVSTAVDNNGNSLAGAALFGFGWFPHTLLGWLIFLVIIFGLIILVRKLMKDHKYAKASISHDDIAHH